ncbi:MAG: glyoxalase superfamily protein [Pseudomonadota bacterium]
MGPIIPILRSFIEAEMRAFYIDYLGFRVDWEHRFEPGLPLYCQLSRGHAILHLSEHHGDCTPGSAVRIWVEDVDAYHHEITQRPHARLNPGIEDQPWGTREMTINDPAGNRVIFVQVERKAE